MNIRSKIIWLTAFGCFGVSADALAQQTATPEPENSEAPAETDTDTTKVYYAIETIPEYPGGTQAFLSDLNKNLHIPQQELASGVRGKALVSFTVLKNGKVGDIVVVQPLTPSIDKAAIRAVSKLKRFKPATQNGKPVLYRYTVPIKVNM